MASPPPSVWLVETGLLSLPVARRTPAFTLSDTSASTPSRARAFHWSVRFWRVLSSGGSARLVFGLTSKPLPELMAAQSISILLLLAE
ncbi:hypothetical protein D3C85_1393270 [compost metagenome]